MANGRYNILGTTYKPLSFEDVARVPQYKQQMQDSFDEGYRQLSGKALSVGTLLDPQNDSKSFKRYQDYMARIKSQADELTQYGVTPTNKRELLNLYYDFDTELTPVISAYNTKLQQVNQYRELKNKDNSIRTSYDPSIMSVDDYLKNPTMQFSSVSGNQIKKSVSDEMKNYSKVMMHGLSNWSSTAEGTMIQRINQFGLTPEDVTEIQQNPSRYPQFAKILQNSIVQSGATNWADRDTLSDLYDFAAAGLYSGMGQPKIETRNLPKKGGAGSGVGNINDVGEFGSPELAFTLVGSGLSDLPSRKEAKQSLQNLESVQRLIEGRGTQKDIEIGKKYKQQLAETYKIPYSQLSWKRTYELAAQSRQYMNQPQYQVNLVEGNNKVLATIAQNLTNGRNYADLSNNMQKQLITDLDGKRVDSKEYDELMKGGNGTFLQWDTSSNNRYAPGSYYHNGRFVLHSDATGKNYLFNNDAGLNSISYKGMNIGQYMGKIERDYDTLFANIMNNPYTNAVQKQERYDAALRSKNQEANDVFGTFIVGEQSSYKTQGATGNENMQLTKKESKYYSNGNE